MQAHIKQIKKELDEYNNELLSDFVGTRERFIMYAIYTFAGLMDNLQRNRDLKDFLNHLNNGLHAMDVLLEWSRAIEERSDDFSDIPPIMPKGVLNYMLDLYDKAEDYSIVTEAFSSRFTSVDIKDKVVTMTSKSETDYLREQASHALRAKRAKADYERDGAVWDKIAKDGTAEQWSQLERIGRNPEYLLPTHLENLESNQLHPTGKRYKMLYAYYTERNKRTCEFDLSCDLGGFTVSDYIAVLSALESVAAENYIKCFALYNDPVLSLYMRFNIGEALTGSVTDPAERIDLLSYWCVTADKDEFISRIAKLSSRSIDVAKRAIAFMTYDLTRDGGHIVESPVIELCGKLIIPPFIVPNYNLMSLLPNKLSTYSPELYIDLMKDVSSKKIAELTEMLREVGGFHVWTEITLMGGNKPITDIDILVHDPRDNAVLLIEHKANCSPYTEKLHYVDKSLRKAESQLEKAKQYITEHRDSFLTERGISADASIDVCILMANNLGSSSSGVTTPIINTDEMYKLIESSRGSLKRLYAGLENENYMRKIDTSTYYVGKSAYEYAGYTFIFDALKFR